MKPWSGLGSTCSHNKNILALVSYGKKMAGQPLLKDEGFLVVAQSEAVL